MRTLALIAIVVGCTYLAGCRISDADGHRRFAVVGISGSPILLDQVTGETWRLTDSGWVPIVKQRATSSASKDRACLIGAIDMELERRKRVNEVLKQNPEASKIVDRYRAGAVTKEGARDLLQRLLPESLGQLPPSAEDGNWSEPNQ